MLGPDWGNTQTAHRSRVTTLTTPRACVLDARVRRVRIGVACVRRTARNLYRDNLRVCEQRMIISSQSSHSAVTAGAHRAMRRYGQLGVGQSQSRGDSLPDRALIT